MSSETKVCDAELVESMVSAVRNGDLEKVKELLNQYGLSCSPTLVEGYILLCHAIDKRHIEVVKLLLEKGAKVNCEPNETSQYLATLKWESEIHALGHNTPSVPVRLVDNYTPLHIACEYSDIDWDQSIAVEMLVSNGANVNAKASKNKTPLHIAAAKCKTEIVEILLSHGAHVSCLGLPNNYTPLHIACRQGRREIVDLLLTRGADVNIKAKDNETPLHIAANVTESKLTEILIKHGADIHCLKLSNNYTPLHEACNELHEKGEVVCELLLVKGADPNIKANDNVTPMHLASQRGHSKVLDTLLKHGAEVNCTRLSDNYTPLHISCENLDTEVVDLLLSNGADPNALTSDNSNPLHLTLRDSEQPLRETPNKLEDSDKIVESLIEHGAQVNCQRSSDNFTPLHVACSAVHHGEAAYELLEAGANPNMKAIDEITPLHLAAERGCTKRIKFLVMHGAILNCPRLSDNYTPLHIACSKVRNTAVCELLLCGADPNFKANDNITPLHLAAKEYDPDIVESLIQHGAQVNCTRLPDNKTPLHLACEKSPSILKVALLLKSGADPNAKANDGSSPLHIAIENGLKNSVERLIENGAEVNCSRLSDGYTPLLLACEVRQHPMFEVRKLLLKSGADPNVSAYNSSTPLLSALKMGNNNCVEQLLDKFADINAKTCEGLTSFDLVCQNLKFDCVQHPSSCNFRILLKDSGSSSIVTRAIQLKAAGLYVSEKNLCFVQQDNSELRALQQASEEEIQRMKCEVVSNRFTLYNVLKDQQNPAYAKSESLMKILESWNYEKFPIYQSFIINCFERSKLRIELLPAGQKSLDCLLKTSRVFNRDEVRILPVELQVEIVSYFSNHELRCLISFGENLKEQFGKFSKCAVET